MSGSGMTRRSFLAKVGVGGGTLLVAACAPAAPAASAPPSAAATADIGRPEKTKLRATQAASTLAFVQVNLARAKGLFTDEGLAVEQLSTNGGGPDLQALIAGEADFNVGAGTYQTDAFRQGRKILNVFNTLERNIINFAMHVDVAKERGITEKMPFKDKLAALKGLKLGATRPGALTFQQAEYLVRLAGFTPQKEVQVVAAGEGPALVAALETRQIDVLVQSVPVPETTIARGKAMMFVNNAAGEDPGLVPFNMENVFTRPDFADQNPNTVARFVRAIRRANELLARETASSLAAALANDEFFRTTDRAVLEAGITSVKAAANRTGVLDRQALVNQLKMQAITDLDVDKAYALFTDRFIRQSGG